MRPGHNSSGGLQESFEAFCARRGIEVVGRIPFDTVVTEAMVQGQPVTAYTACPERSRRNGRVTEALRQVWQEVKGSLALEPIG